MNERWRQKKAAGRAETRAISSYRRIPVSEMTLCCKLLKTQGERCCFKLPFSGPDEHSCEACTLGNSQQVPNPCSVLLPSALGSATCLRPASTR